MRIPFLSDLGGWLQGGQPLLEERADALSVQSGSVATGSSSAVANLVTGMGTSRDSTTYSRPNLGRFYLTPDECFALMRGGIYRRICEIRPSWATKRGWSTGSDDLDKRLADLKVSTQFRWADTWGRSTGESRLWIVTSSGLKGLDRPLRRSEKVMAIHRLDRREFWPEVWETDVLSPFYGRPIIYTVQPTRPGITAPPVRVHASRLLDFYGHDLAPSEHGAEAWGDRDAVAQVIWSALSGLDTTTASGARIAAELMLSVFKISGTAGVGTSDQAESLIERIRGTNLMKSISNSIYLGAEEGFERQPANVTGYRDLSDQARIMLSAVDGTPQTLLFGMAPAGFNTDGESWQEMWYADVAEHQATRYTDHLLTLARQISGSDDVELTFRPLSEMDDLERASVRLSVVQADRIEMEDGVLTAAERRARYSTGKFTAEFEGGLAEVAEAGEPAFVVDPEDEEAARAMVEAVMATGAAPQAEGAEEPADAPAPQAEASAAREPLMVGQITAMMEPAARVAGNTLPRESAQAILEVGVALSPEEARRVLNPVKILPTEPQQARADVAEGPSQPPPAVEAASLEKAWIGLVVDPTALPDLPADAHLTLLYLGEVDPQDQDVVTDLATAVMNLANHTPPWSGQVFTRTTLGGAPHGTHIVYEPGDRWVFDTMHGELLMALAHRVTARQHAQFRPHITVAPLPGDAELPAPQRVQLDEPITLGTIQLAIGKRVITETSLGGG